MRINLPVTGREHQLSGHDLLVSVTDLQGRITYCNTSFQQVSGFAREELMGQAHNIIRHPDMPEEAFRDLWATLASGSPWTGVVKNRRKNGDHYWVLAHAAPMYRGDRIVGFISVRTPASRQAIQAADGLYATMRNEVAQGQLRTGLAKGVPINLGTRGRLARTLHLGDRSVMALVLVLGGLAIASLSAWNLRAGIVAAIVLPCVAAAFMWLRYIRPFEALVPLVNQLATGDLMVAIPDVQRGPARGLARALAQLSVNLKAIGSDVRAEVDALRQAVNDITHGNRELSARTDAQASNVEQTAASMEEISSTASQNAASARRGEEMSQGMRDGAHRSEGAMQRVNQAMRDIDSAWRSLADMVGTIEGVAFQTNLLALNAAVEAARAGDAGRGFAVVAGEVRALSNRVTLAAGEIKQLISSSSQRVKVGDQEVLEAATRMNEALASVQEVASVLGQIALAAGEQQVGVSQVSDAVSQLDHITQQNAAMVESLASSTITLNEHAQRVDEAIQLLRVSASNLTLAELDAVSLRRAAKSPTENLVCT